MSHFIYYYAESQYAVCRHAECCHAECCHAECHHAECCRAECCHADCRCAECRVSVLTTILAHYTITLNNLKNANPDAKVTLILILLLC